MTHARLALGASGEERVAAWYAARGWTVLARNWTVRGGELDVVAGKGRVVAFCEVKTRSSLAFGSPADAVGWQKQRRLRALAAQWLAANRGRAGGRVEVRFDVATVVGDAVDVIEGAF